MNRRHFLAVTAAALTPAACRRSAKSRGYAGYAFVANSQGAAVAAVDLSVLAVTRHIALGENPVAIAANPRTGMVYVLAGASLVEISHSTLAVARRRALPGPGAALAVDAEGAQVWIAGEKALYRLDAKDASPAVRIGLDASPASFDVAGKVAVSLGAAGKVLILDAASLKTSHTLETNGEAGFVRFRRDRQTLMTADRAGRRLLVHDVATGRLVVELPLAVRPDRAAMKDDGGQLFITGEGADAVVTVYPYRTEVGSFTLAGRSPGFVAASSSPDLLLAANPSSNDVTIVNVATQKVMAVAPVGRHPEFIAVTPDSEFALVLNRESGDAAVLHLPTIVATRSKRAPLVTMIPVGSAPAGAVIVPLLARA